MQARFVDDFHGAFLIILSNKDGNWTKIYRKTDPNSRDIGKLVKTYNVWLYGDNLVHNGLLYIGRYGIYTIDAKFNLKKVYNTVAPKAITSFELFNGVPHATLIQGFRAKSGQGLLLKETPSKWEIAKYFPEPEAWCQETMWDNLYVGTRKEGGGSKVYEMDKNYKSKVVGTTKADGFFSLRGYKGKLFAGTYSMSKVRSYLYW